MKTKNISRLCFRYMWAFAVLFFISACIRQGYDMDQSNKIVTEINQGAEFDQNDYAEMIKVLDSGYSYLKERIAEVAFDNDPTAAVQDFLSILNDSALRQVQKNSRIIIDKLQSADLNSHNQEKFQEVYGKYREMDQSLVTDSVGLSR